MSAFSFASMGIGEKQFRLWDAEDTAESAAHSRVTRSASWMGTSGGDWSIAFRSPDGTPDSYHIVYARTFSDAVMQIDRIANRTGWRFA